VPMNNWLESELQRGLRGVAAPPELWDRLRAAKVEKPVRTNRALVWAMAASVALGAVGLSTVHRPNIGGDEAFALHALAGDTQRVAFHCQNPAQLRAWVRAKTGLDVPLREESSPSIQLIGAQMIDGTRGVEVAYRAANRDAVLVVSPAGAGLPTVPHGRVTGDVSSWVKDGQQYTLASNDLADLQLACKLCHLD
jgi:hypothetical protein